MAVGDYDGTDGTGELFLLSTDLAGFDSGSTTVSIANSDLSGAVAPSGVRRLAAMVAFYLDPDDASRSAPVPLNKRGAVSTLLIRHDGLGGTPFGPGGNDIANPFPVGTFLNVSAATYTAPDAFVWEDATGASSNAPLYSMHELMIERTQHMPPLVCEPNENEKLSEWRQQWLVIKPFATNCAPDERFTLPTLPATFPRGSIGAQKRGGFEQRVGSGATCTVSANCDVGEACVDPDGAGTGAGLMCLGGGGTEQDPYFQEDYIWRLHLYDLDVSSFDFNNFDFSTRRRDLTHESTNERGIN